jgi:hypothetical protein
MEQQTRLRMRSLFEYETRGEKLEAPTVRSGGGHMPTAQHYTRCDAIAMLDITPEVSY